MVLEQTDTTTYEYLYDSEGNLAKKVDKTTGKAVNYQYDSLGRLIHSYQSVNDTVLQRTEHIYDTSNRISSQSWQLGDTTYSESYTYDADDGSLTSMTPAVGSSISFTYDALKRLSTKTTGVVTQSYTYRNIDSSQTTTQVSRIGYTAANGSNVSDFSIYYTYDDLGNVASVSSSARTVLNASYVYDQQGQLIQETNNNGTMYYTYDTYGNIRSVSGDSSHTYTYDTGDWLDLLVKYDGVSITYDAIGNPLKYYNGTGWNFTWQNGRQMATATKRNTSASNSLALSFTYDVAGIRDSKTVTTPSGTVTYNYLTQNGNVVQQTWTENGTKHTIDFIYDNAGSPYAFVYDDAIYYYVLNLQGDVILILNSSGGTVARYAYDAWGKIIYASGDMVEINPLRYRGYYYDTETKLYYLQSRYYDPLVKRFVNADGLVSTGQDFIGYNMYVYCNNSPTSYIDSAGDIGIIATVAAGVVGGITGALFASNEGDNVIAGAVIGAISAAVGLHASILGGVIISMVGNIAETCINNSFCSIKWDTLSYEIAINAIIGSTSGFVGGILANEIADDLASEVIVTMTNGLRDAAGGVAAKVVSEFLPESSFSTNNPTTCHVPKSCSGNKNSHSTYTGFTPMLY